MECRDVREMADSFLGEELLTETNHEILRHLDTCPVCRADLAGRRALREGVQRAFHRALDLGPRPEFIAQLRTTLQDTAHQGSARRGVRFHGWWALAATVLLAVALGVAYRGREWITATGALARVAVGDHRYCALQFRLAEKPISLEEAAQRYGAAYRVLERLPPDDVMTAIGPAHVLERHACVYEGRRFAHIVFTYRGERVSLLVTAVDGGVTPALPGETLPHLSSPNRIDGMSVVSFRASRQMVFFAGDVVQNDLLKLAEAVGEPLYRGLAATESASAPHRSGTSAVEDLFALDLGIGSSPVSVHVLRARKSPSMRILGICGSLQRKSGNLTLLKIAAASTPPDVEVVLFDGLSELPHFNPDIEASGTPESVMRWRRALAESDAVLIATPEYGFSLPGVLKNGIDWAIGSGELEGKVVAITAAVPAPERGRRGLQALRDTLSAVRATIVGGEPIPKGPEHDRCVAELVRALIAAAANLNVSSTSGNATARGRTGQS